MEQRIETRTNDLSTASSEGWPSLAAFWAAVEAEHAARRAADPVPADIRHVINAALDEGYCRDGRTIRMLEDVREVVASRVIAHDRDSIYSSTTTTRYQVVMASGAPLALVVTIAGSPDGVAVDVTVD